jgi:6-phosphogluconolactonase
MISEKSYVYVSTYEGPEGGGIYCARFDKKTGEISRFRKVAALERAGLMTQHPQKNCLYSVCVDEKSEAPNGCVAAYSVDIISGDLKLLNRQLTGAGLPTFITVTHDGKYLLQVSFTTAAGSVLRVKDDGSLEKCGKIQSFSGSGPNPVRQSRSTPHCIDMHPVDNTVFVCDLGADQIVRFRLDSEQGELVRMEPSQQSVNPGAGPRILRFSDDGKNVYVINELDNTISVYSYDHEKKDIAPQQVVSTLPGSVEGGFDKQMTSEMRLHPYQGFLYASNRSVGEGRIDGITVFKRDTSNGKLCPVQYQPTGKHPRHFNIDQSGRWLFVSARDSDIIQIFNIHQGQLKEPGTSVAFRQPWDIRIVGC